jgi:hypothetical protein
MSRATRCPVCLHPQLLEINKALAAKRVQQRDLAATFGLSQFALSRHKHRCVARAVTKALERQELITGASLIANTTRIQSIVQSSLETCAIDGNHAQIAPLANSYHKGNEMLAKLAGLEGFRPASSTTNVAINAPGAQFGIIMPFQTALQSVERKELAAPDVIDAELIES